MGYNQAIRNAYGPLVTRTALRTSSQQSFKNSPGGQFVIILFASVFDDKSSAVETVVLECQDSLSCSIREYIIN